MPDDLGLTDCICGQEKHIDPICAALGMCSREQIHCGDCNQWFDPTNLGNVFDHEHRGLPDVHGISGKRKGLP